MENTDIEWCDHTFNAWEGCTKIGPGCDNCYAEARNSRFHTGKNWGPGAPRLTRSDAYWATPLKWERNHKQFFAIHKRRQRVFCSSLADIFDNEAPEGEREKLWELIRKTPNIDWLLLTKRASNISKMLPEDWGNGYPNVWLGLTVVNQFELDRDLPKLIEINALVRWLSMEPLLDYVTLPPTIKNIDWIVVGGESRQRSISRPMRYRWAIWLRDQCIAAGIAFLFKQWGDWAPAIAGMRFEPLPSGPQFKSRLGGATTIAFQGDLYYGAVRIGKKTAGRILDGQIWDQYPKASSL